MGIRISEMEEATTFGADDYVPIVTNGTNKKALGQKIKDFIAGFFVAKDDNSRLITSLGQTFTDCNTVMTSGMYSANMGTVSNAPAGTMVSSNGGQLIVTQRASDVRVFQTLFVYVGSGSKTEIYVRAQNNATSFSDWRHITAADGISFDNTGTGLSASNVQAGIEELNECKLYYKVVSGTTNSYGFIDVGVNANQFTLISAIKLSSNDNGEMAIPYRNTNASNSPQSLFIYNNNFVARSNVSVTFLAFFAKKVTEIS